jgi:hypothetical protein
MTTFLWLARYRKEAKTRGIVAELRFQGHSKRRNEFKSRESSAIIVE